MNSTKTREPSLTPFSFCLDPFDHKESLREPCGRQPFLSRFQLTSQGNTREYGIPSLNKPSELGTVKWGRVFLLHLVKTPAAIALFSDTSIHTSGTTSGPLKLLILA